MIACAKWLRQDAKTCTRDDLCVCKGYKMKISENITGRDLQELRNNGLDVVADYILSLREAMKWINMTEKTPEQRKHVLVWRKTNSCVYSCMLYETRDFIILGTATDYIPRDEVEYWMPHPTAPNVELTGAAPNGQKTKPHEVEK